MKFDNNSSYNKTNEGPSSLPSYPKICGNQGCHNKADQVRIVGANGGGIKFYAPLSVCNQTEVRGQKFLTIKDGVQFMHWWTRCNECFGREMRDYKAKQKLEGEHHYYC